MPEAAESPQADERLSNAGDGDPPQVQAAPTMARPTRRPAAGPGVGARGVTGRGVVALIVVATLMAGLFDIATHGHRGHLFGLVFVVASAVGALVVRHRDLQTAMVAPPLLYCVLVAVMSMIDEAGAAGGFASRVVFYVGNAFVTGAPAIWSGTALAVAIGWYRRRR